MEFTQDSGWSRDMKNTGAADYALKRYHSHIIFNIRFIKLFCRTIRNIKAKKRQIFGFWFFKKYCIESPMFCFFGTNHTAYRLSASFWLPKGSGKPLFSISLLSHYGDRYPQILCLNMPVKSWYFPAVTFSFTKIFPAISFVKPDMVCEKIQRVYPEILHFRA